MTAEELSKEYIEFNLNHKYWDEYELLVQCIFDEKQQADFWTEMLAEKIREAMKSEDPEIEKVLRTIWLNIFIRSC